MRPAGQGSTESLYFRYPTFEARAVPEQGSAATRHRVVIAGAGPIGMTAALILARHGIASVVPDKKNTFNDGSRAICIARASMHIFERAGAVEAFVDKALGWRFGRSYYQGKPIYRLEMPHPPGEKYLPMYNLQQQYIEQFLHDAVQRTPLIDMRWQSEVTGIDARTDGVSLDVASPPGDYPLHADYVLSADGARSPIRSMLGLRMKGDNYEGQYVIADIQMAHDFPTERRAFFESAGNPGGTVLIHKQPDNLWRVDYQLREGESEADALREDNLRARIQCILDDIGHTGPWALEWWSIYTANTLCLDDYKHGRVLFVGDSAHIVPIFGVRGLNNGLADAHNAAWKLAYVLKGVAKPALLDSYSPERRGATLDVFANALKSTRFMTPPSRGWQLARQAALSLAVKNAFTRDFANPRQMQPYTYADSPITLRGCSDGTIEGDDDTVFSGGPVPGSASPNVELDDGSHLLDHVGDGFSVVWFVDDAMDAHAKVGFDAMRALDPTFSVYRVVGDGLREAEGSMADTFHAVRGTAYLLRPDQHIAARWRVLDVEAMVRALQICLGAASP